MHAWSCSIYRRVIALRVCDRMIEYECTVSEIVQYTMPHSRSVYTKNVIVCIYGMDFRIYIMFSVLCMRRVRGRSARWSNQFCGPIVDLAAILGDAWRAPKVGRCWSMGKLSPPQHRGPGERRELPLRGSGHSPCRKRILAYFEGHRTLLFVDMTKSEGDNLH